MYKETVTHKDIIDFLNEVLKLDEGLGQALVYHRIPCNKAIAEHPSIQVTKEHTVGFLGLLNGLLGANENQYGCIYAGIGEKGRVLKFFLKYDDKDKSYYWAYIHSDGELHITKSFFMEDIERAKTSSYIKQFFGPWECNSLEEAKQRLEEELKVKGE